MLEKYNYKKFKLNQPFFNDVIVKKKLLNIKYLQRIISMENTTTIITKIQKKMSYYSF